MLCMGTDLLMRGLVTATSLPVRLQTGGFAVPSLLDRGRLRSKATRGPLNIPSPEKAHPVRRFKLSSDGEDPTVSPFQLPVGGAGSDSETLR